jgi:hypothetical protein
MDWEDLQSIKTTREYKDKLAKLELESSRLPRGFADLLLSVSGRAGGSGPVVGRGVEYWREKILEYLRVYPINTPAETFGLRIGNYVTYINKSRPVYFETPVYDRMFDLGLDVVPWTPFQFACCTGNVELVEFMLEQGGDPTIRDVLGHDAIGIAQMAERSRVEYPEQITIYRADYQGVIATIERGRAFKNFPNFFTKSGDGRDWMDVRVSFKDSGFKKKRDDSDSVGNKNFKF